MNQRSPVNLKFLFVWFFFITLSSSGISQKFYSKLQEYCVILTQEFNKIPGERKDQLNELAGYISENLTKKEPVQILFVCTNNSRRSQFAEIWAQTAAYYYGLKNISSYSGGIQQTAINYMIIESLKRAGFSVTASEVYSENPVYLVSPGRRWKDIFVFSKKIDYWNNPNGHFACVYCSKNLINNNMKIPGSIQTIELPYDNVKIFDNSPGGNLKNDKICKEIGREMFYVMHVVKINRKRKN